jgi:hypothetical protein
MFRVNKCINKVMNFVDDNKFNYSFVNKFFGKINTVILSRSKIAIKQSNIWRTANT